MAGTYNAGLKGYPSGPPRSIEQVLGILAGAASMCWETPSGAGVFQSEKASALVQQAHEHIKRLISYEINTLADSLGLGQVKTDGSH